jgi:hypothetical protein
VVLPRIPPHPEFRIPSILYQVVPNGLQLQPMLTFALSTWTMKLLQV